MPESAALPAKLIPTGVAARWRLALILLFTIAGSLPWFASTILPFHDTKYVAECFHLFYSGMQVEGEWVRWVPYGVYGNDADIYQLALNPMHHVVGLGGLLIGARDTLFLSKLAMLLNELVFAWGLFLLGRELYSNWITQAVVCVGGVLAVSWQQQVMFNLMVFYLLPTVMWLVLKFLKTGNPSLLFLAGIAEVCSLLGNVTYIAPLHFWLMAAVVAPQLPGHVAQLRGLFSVRMACNPWLWVLFLVVIAYASYILGIQEQRTWLSPGRDAETGRITLETFLNYGRFPVRMALFGFTTGGLPHADNTYYIGLLPLALFVWALVREPSHEFLGIAIACVALIWLSVGGTFAECVYRLPGMNAYRHIGLTFGIVGLLLLLGAGFGFDGLLLQVDRPGVRPPPCLAVRLMGMSVVGALLIADVWKTWHPDDWNIQFEHPNWLQYFTWRAGLYLVAGVLICVFLAWQKSRGPVALKLAMCVLGLTYFAEMASYRVQCVMTVPTVSAAESASHLYDAAATVYRESRSRAPVDERGQTAWPIVLRKLLPYHNGSTVLEYSFLGMDPCRPEFRADGIARPIFEMITARNPGVSGRVLFEAFPGDDEPFMRSLGCGASKLRLTGTAFVTSDLNDAIGQFQRLERPDRDVVILDDASSPAGELIEATDWGTVRVTGFSANRLRVHAEVATSHPVWLVYADAWHPGWAASVDGRAARVHRANVGFKAVRLDSGPHEVEFAFRSPWRTFVAHGVAAMALAAGLGLCAAMLICAAPVLRPGYDFTCRAAGGL